MGKINIQDIVDGTFCISLTNRKDRRKKVKKHMKKRKMPFKFYDAIKNQKNPAKGCLQSHLNIIKKAKATNKKAVLIIEDDCFFIKRPINMITPPENWDMLYLGGNLQEVLDKKEDDFWYRMRCWTTHSYIIRNTLYDKVIEDLEKYDKEIDRYYCEVIHKDFNCYMCDPPITKQLEGYSDIAKKKVAYNFNTNPNEMVPFKEPDFEQKGDQYTLKLRNFEDIELPLVSIITPTHNRKIFFELALNNFLTQDYPKNKLEWIILDDGNEDLTNMLPKGDKRIKYIKMKGQKGLKTTISHKRNYGFEQSSGEIIIHMDDDDYYLPSSVSTRVKVLLNYKEQGIKCVGCERFGCHDLQKDVSFVIDKNNELAEASMGYFREFIQERKFNRSIAKGEGKLFCRGRNKHIMKLPFEFIFISFTHGNNTHTRTIDKSKANKTFGFDFGVFKILRNIKKQLF